jgi:hypothetical protein
VSAVHPPIRTWLDGYLALRHRAFETRGSIELDTGDRWPRTTGGEALTIAAAFDAVVLKHTTPPVLRRWRDVLAELQRDAYADLHRTYSGNRPFWSTLESVALFLDGIGLRPPAERAWNALIEAIGTGPRNVGPPDGVATFDDLYNAQRRYLGELRGVDRMPPDEENVVKRLMERVCRKAALPESGWHRLRHSFGTHAAMFGVNPWRLMTWMGHKRVDETMLYVYLADQHRREIPQPVLKARARETDPDLRILAMLGERHSAWQPRGSEMRKTHESRLTLVG